MSHRTTKCARINVAGAVAGVAAALAVLMLACGSGDETATETKPPELAASAKTELAPNEPNRKKAPADEQTRRFNLRNLIQKQKADLRKVPGRVGLLAEKKMYSLFDEELIIRDFFGDRRDGFFVDVGCAWPIIANNTYYLEKHLGWKGIGIDALSDYAEAWQRDRSVSKFFNFLVSDKSSDSAVFFKSASMGLSSADQNRADGTHFGGELEVEEITLPSISLNDLLDREGIEKIDLLAMDIEGHELTALHGFDIDRFQPELVITEGKRSEVAAFFAEHGYEVIERYRPFDTVNDYYRRTQN